MDDCLNGHAAFFRDPHACCTENSMGVYAPKESVIPSEWMDRSAICPGPKLEGQQWLASKGVFTSIQQFKESLKVPARSDLAVTLGVDGKKLIC